MAWDNDEILDIAVAKCAFAAIAGELPRSGRGYQKKELWLAVEQNAAVITPLPACSVKGEWLIASVKQTIANVRQLGFSDQIPSKGCVSAALNTLGQVASIEAKAGKLKTADGWQQLPKNYVAALA